MQGMFRTTGWMMAVFLLAAGGCGKKTAKPQTPALTPTETVKLFYETLEKMPAAEKAKTDAQATEARKTAIRQAADLVAVDHLRQKAGYNPVACKGANIAIALIIATQSLMARPDFQRVYHTEKIEGEEATVGFTLVATTQNTRTEHEVKLVKERNAWRLARF